MEFLHSKKILKEGIGLYTPNERGTVVVCVTCNNDEKINGAKHEFILGEPRDETWYRIEQCILSMKEGEEVILEDMEIYIKLISFKRAVDFWLLDLRQKLSLAENYKVHGNEHFKKGEYKIAAMFYSKALKYIISTGDELNTDLKIACLNNMAACLLKLNSYHHCYLNCTKILQKQPKNSKALFRRGCACLEMGELEQAESDLIKVSDIEKGNQSIVNKLKEIQKAKEQIDKKYQETMKKMFGETHKSNNIF